MKNKYGDKNHTKELLEKAHRGEKDARDILVQENMGLVGCIVKRFSGRGYEDEDLLQIGSIGLMKAIDRFDTSMDVCFSTYAVPMITGEIRRFLRDDGMIKVSRTQKEYAVKIKHAVDAYRQQYFKEPTIEEISTLTGLAMEEIACSYEATAGVESLDQTIFTNDGGEVCLMDKIQQEEDAHELAVNRMAVRELVDRLPEVERNIIVGRYFLEYTQTQLAKQLGISQVQVSRIEKRVLEMMRKKL